MRQLRQGSRGPGVELLQLALDRAGFSTARDGIFGPDTKKALQSFQQAQGLIPRWSI